MERQHYLQHVHHPQQVHDLQHVDDSQHVHYPQNVHDPQHVQHPQHVHHSQYSYHPQYVHNPQQVHNPQRVHDPQLMYHPQLVRNPQHVHNPQNVHYPQHVPNPQLLSHLQNVHHPQHVHHSQHYGAGSLEALQAAMNADMYKRSLQTLQTVPVYDFSGNNMRTMQYNEPARAIADNFTYNTGVSQGFMGGRRFMPPLYPSMPVSSRLPLTPAQLAHWQVIRRAQLEMEHARYMQQQRAYEPTFAGDSYFGGRFSPASSIQTTGLPRHAGTFQCGMLEEDLHSQYEAVAKAMTKAEDSKENRPTGLSAFPPNTGFLLDQLDFSHLYPPPQYFPRSESGPGGSSLTGNNPPTPPRSVFGDSRHGDTFYPAYQDTMTYGDNQCRTDTENVWRQHSPKQVTSSHNDEPGRYDIQKIMQPGGTAHSPVTSSSQHISFPHAAASANPGGKKAVSPWKPDPPVESLSPWPFPIEEPPSYQTGSDPTDNNDNEVLKKEIEDMTVRLTKLTESDDDVVKEPGDKAAENIVPCTEKKRQKHGWFRSRQRGRRNAQARQKDKPAGTKAVHSVGKQGGPKGTQKTAQGMTATKVTAKVDTAKETSKKEIRQVKGTPSATQKTSATGKEKANSAKAPSSAAEPGSSADKDEAAEGTWQTYTRARGTSQRKKKGKAPKKRN